MKVKTKRIIIPVTPSMHKRLKELAHEQDISISRIVRKSIEYFLDKEVTTNGN